MGAQLEIIGGGRMGEALVTGLLAAKWCDPAELAIVERLPDRREVLQQQHADVQIVDTPVSSDGAVIAVKPDDVAPVCGAVRSAGVARVLSIAAGVTTARIEEALEVPIPVIRAMPNTPALVGAGASAIAPGSSATEDDLAWAESILAAVGTVVRVKEPLLDAVTGLSGSGPAYIFLIAESLVEAGVLAGLPRDVSEKLTFQTLLGSAKLLLESGDHAAALRAAVTSPGGTTAAALKVLEKAGVRGALLDAVDVATRRSTELGRQ
jgi:pyrroline-5-carboxylate reductase